MLTGGPWIGLGCGCSDTSADAGLDSVACEFSDSLTATVSGTVVDPIVATVSGKLVRAVVTTVSGTGSGVDANTGVDAGAGVNAGAGIGTGARSGIDDGTGIDTDVRSGTGVDSEIPGFGCSVANKSGRAAGSGVAGRGGAGC